MGIGAASRSASPEADCEPRAPLPPRELRLGGSRLRGPARRPAGHRVVPHGRGRRRGPALRPRPRGTAAGVRRGARPRDGRGRLGARVRRAGARVGRLSLPLRLPRRSGPSRGLRAAGAPFRDPGRLRVAGVRGSLRGVRGRDVRRVPHELSPHPRRAAAEDDQRPRRRRVARGTGRPRGPAAAPRGVGPGARGGPDRARARRAGLARPRPSRIGRARRRGRRPPEDRGAPEAALGALGRMAPRAEHVHRPVGRRRRGRAARDAPSRGRRRGRPRPPRALGGCGRRPPRRPRGLGLARGPHRDDHGGGRVRPLGPHAPRGRRRRAHAPPRRGHDRDARDPRRVRPRGRGLVARAPAAARRSMPASRPSRARRRLRSSRLPAGSSSTKPAGRSSGSTPSRGSGSARSGWHFRTSRPRSSAAR